MRRPVIGLLCGVMLLGMLACGAYALSGGCLNYIANRKLGSVPMTVFRLIACGLVFVGAQLSFGLVWDLADVLMGIMAIINLPVIVILGRTAMRALQDYMEQRRAGKNPVFKASSIGLKEKTDFWN